MSRLVGIGESIDGRIGDSCGCRCIEQERREVWQGSAVETVRATKSVEGKLLKRGTFGGEAECNLKSRLQPKM